MLQNKSGWLRPPFFLYKMELWKILLYLKKYNSMKRFAVFTVLFSLFLGTFLQAQEPTTTWPYVNNDFSNAVVYLKSGGKLEYLANIHLQNSQLHYVKGNNIMEAAMNDILVVELASKRYMNINSSLMEIVAEGEKGFVAKFSKPDYSKLNETGGAYGASSNTTSTKALTSLEGFSSVTTHMLQQSEKENGKVIPLKHEYYIVANGSVYPAQKKLFEKMLPANKQAAMKGFLKENKIRWSNPEDLLKLVKFLEN